MNRRVALLAALVLSCLAPRAHAQEPASYEALQREFEQQLKADGDAVAVAKSFATRFAARSGAGTLP